MTAQDFTKGVNFSVLTTADGTAHEQLIELAVPTKDTGEEKGKGLILVTTDSALDTPVVPNASVTLKWKRYIWLRRPFAGATVKTGKTYYWNDDAISVTTYLKWVFSTLDTTQLQTDVATALSNAANALNIANIAQNTAADANTEATNATATANIAAANAVTANGTATTAASDAVTAKNDAASALSKATAALAAAQAVGSITGLDPGTAGQKIRVNAAGTDLEYFNDIKQYVKVSDTRASGVIADVLTTGAVWQKRTIQTTDNDSGSNLVSLAASVITLKKGIYRVNIKASGYHINDNKIRLYQTSGVPATLIVGMSSYSSTAATGVFTCDATLTGIITIADDITTLEVQHKVFANGFGGNATSAGESEVYLVAEFTRID